MADRNDSRFRNLYQTLLPRLQGLEERRRSLRNTIVGGVVTAALGVGSCSTAFDPPQFLATLPAWRYGPLAFSLLAFACFGLAIARFLVPGVTGYANYRAHFKKDVVASLVRAVQPGARYFADRHLKRELYDQSRLFRTQLGTFRGDDLLQGSAGETPFECSELEASYSTGSGKNRTTHRVFTGLFFRIDFDRDFQGHTVVQPAKAAGGDRAGMQQVTLDDVFGDAFAVWSTRPDEARALLSPELRGRLLELVQHAGAPLHFAFAGRIAYAAADYGRHLFEPGIAVSLKEADLPALAAPFDVADDVVKALGLERRRRPADAGFHAAGFAVGGMEKLVDRIAAGENLGIEDVAEAAAAEADAAPVVPPLDPFPRVIDTGAGVEVHYPLTFATLLVLAIGLLLTPTLIAAVWNWVSPSFASELRPLIESRWPQWSEAGELLIAYPTPFVLFSLFFWWMFVGTLLYRPSLVTIDPGGISIRRLFLPWSSTLPLTVIRRVDATNRSVTFVRADRSLLRSMVMASPNLRSDAEARWLAAQLRQALKRSGWRPASRSLPGSA